MPLAKGRRLTEVQRKHVQVKQRPNLDPGFSSLTGKLKKSQKSIQTWRNEHRRLIDQSVNALSPLDGPQYLTLVTPGLRDP